ncbi:MAG: inositol monophosphatase family protein [Pseudomonas profundi]|uniref:inositol monophosphatase family protein n=1 Tax=Pseudomonas profundi TaxID=1981513 RepID=UPI003003204D
MSQLDHAQVLQQVIREVAAAGELLIAEWQRPSGPRGSGDKADVDIEIERLLRSGLVNILECDFWGEETGSQLNGAEHCWVVDPNDGTADFLNGFKGSSISVGLLSRSKPVLGVVYAPVTDDRGSDCIAWALGMNCIYRNGVMLKRSLCESELQRSTSVLVSNGARKKPELNAQLCAPATPVPTTSIAYRLAAVAAGDAVAAISLVPTSAHDVVAGHAILLGAGGVLIDEAGEAIAYDSVERLKTTSRRCFGGAPAACRELMRRDWDSVFR